MEKGFLHIGSETDGSTVPDDIGWGKPATSKQGHYIGKRSLALPENVREDRLQLVGISGAGIPTPAGCHLRLPGSTAPSDGWITSAGALSTDGSPVGLAMLRAGRARTGGAVEVYDDAQRISMARIVHPCFYDPAGVRMNA
jgi:sarcosine oxidase subunit alpha